MQCKALVIKKKPVNYCEPLDWRKIRESERKKALKALKFKGGRSSVHLDKSNEIFLKAQ